MGHSFASQLNFSFFIEDISVERDYSHGNIFKLVPAGLNDRRKQNKQK